MAHRSEVPPDTITPDTQDRTGAVTQPGPECRCHGRGVGAGQPS